MDGNSLWRPFLNTCGTIIYNTAHNLDKPFFAVAGKFSDITPNCVLFFYVIYVICVTHVVYVVYVEPGHIHNCHDQKKPQAALIHPAARDTPSHPTLHPSKLLEADRESNGGRGGLCVNQRRRRFKKDVAV